MVDQLFGLYVWDVLKDKAGCFGYGISGDIKQFDNVGSAVKSLQDFGFAVDLLCSDGFEDLDYAVLIVCSIDALIHFGVFAAAKFLLDLVRLNLAPVNVVFVVEGVVLGAVGTNLLVGALKL
jgi:hypothetical protein